MNKPLFVSVKEISVEVSSVSRSRAGFFQPFRGTLFLFKKNCRGYRGLDEYLQTELLKELPEHVRYINYTEDMGVEGLRNYKRRLAPYYLKTRYQVSVERMG